MVWSVSEDDNNEYQLRNIQNDIQYDDQYAEDSIKENKIGFVSPERRYEAPTVVRPPQM